MTRHLPVALTNFFAEVEAVVAREQDQASVVADVDRLLAELIRSDLRTWITQNYARPPSGKSGLTAGYGQYCLYRRARALSVIVFWWRPGGKTPVHDHLSWGAVGFVSGGERETRYRRVNDPTAPDSVRLQEVGVQDTKAGETSRIISPACDIHRVENPGNEPSVSLHVYGCDMGTQERRCYNLQTQTYEWYVTPHDSDEIVIS